MPRTMNAVASGKKAKPTVNTAGARRGVVKAGADEPTPQQTRKVVTAGPDSMPQPARKLVTAGPDSAPASSDQRRVLPTGQYALNLPRSGAQIHQTFDPMDMPSVVRPTMNSMPPPPIPRGGPTTGPAPPRRTHGPPYPTSGPQRRMNEPSEPSVPVRSAPPTYPSGLLPTASSHRPLQSEYAPHSARSSQHLGAPVATSMAVFQAGDSNVEHRTDRVDSAYGPPPAKHIKLDPPANAFFMPRVGGGPPQARSYHYAYIEEDEPDEVESEMDDEPIVVTARNRKSTTPPDATGVLQPRIQPAGYHRHTAQAAIQSGRDGGAFSGVSSAVNVDQSQPRHSSRALKAPQTSAQNAGMPVTREVAMPALAQSEEPVVTRHPERVEVSDDDFFDEESPAKARVKYFDEICPPPVPFRCDTCHGIQGYHNGWCFRKPIDWAGLDNLP